MMWKDEGYMASGEKLIGLSLKTFSNAPKVFGHVSKPLSSIPTIFHVGI